MLRLGLHLTEDGQGSLWAERRGREGMMTLWGGGGGWWQDRSLAWLSTGLVYLSRGETRKKRAPYPAVFHGLDH